jgi:hypothetical protein
MKTTLINLRFKHFDNGGNCEALIYIFDNGDSLMITDDSGLGIPEDENKEILLGYYDAEFIEVGYLTFENFDELKVKINAILDNPSIHFAEAHNDN